MLETPTNIQTFLWRTDCTDLYTACLLSVCSTETLTQMQVTQPTLVCFGVLLTLNLQEAGGD